MLSVKQGDINNYFLILWYDSTEKWTLVSRAIGEYSTQKANAPVVQIVNVCMAGDRVTKTAELFAEAEKVMTAFEKEGRTSSLKQNSGEKR